MKKNKKNKHQEVRTDFSQPYSVSHQETKAPEEKGVVYWLKKIFTVQGMSILIGVLGLAFVIYDHWPQKETEKLKTEIAKKIPELKKQLKSDIIPHELDTLAEVKVMNEFATAANSFATITENLIEDANSKSEKYDNLMLRDVVLSYKDQNHMFFDHYKKFNNMVVLMTLFAGEEKVNSIIGREFVKKLSDQVELADSASQIYFKKATVSVQNKDNKKALEQVKEVLTNEEYLKFVNMSLDYVTKVNRLIEIRATELKKEHNL